MKCPGCSEIMITIEFDEFEVDHCLACRGVWLDSGELALLLSDEGAAETKLDLLKDALTQSASQRRCPICDRKMELVGFADAAGPVLDRCQRGHGLWFDRGELHSVIQRLDRSLHSKIATRLRSVFER